MRRFILIGLGFLTFSRLLAQEQNRVLPEFTQIVSRNNARIELIQADRNSLFIDGSADAIKNTEADVHNNTLVIGSVSNSEHTVIRVYFKTLKSISLDGSSEAYTTSQISTPELNIVLDGAAKADLDVKASLLTGKSDGAAAVLLKGDASRFSWFADGASDLNASAFITDTAAMITDGAARAAINVKKTVNIKASGTSFVTFEGGAPARSISVSGTASVSDKEGKQEFSENPLDNKGDTTRVKIGKRHFIIIDDDIVDLGKDGKKKEERVRMKRVWSGFELGLNSFMTPDMNFNMKKNYEFLQVKYQSSWFFGLNLLEANAHIIRNKLALTTGLGMEFVNFNFEKNDVLVPDTNVLIASNPSGRSYSTNRLYNFNLNAPFLLKFAPNPKSFHIAVGVIVNFVAVSHVKTISTSQGYEEENIIRDDFNINPFRATATVRVGYGHLKLFANYGLTPYFDSSKAPDVRTFAAGLTLIGF